MAAIALRLRRWLKKTVMSAVKPNASRKKAVINNKLFMINNAALNLRLYESVLRLYESGSVIRIHSGFHRSDLEYLKKPRAKG